MRNSEETADSIRQAVDRLSQVLLSMVDAVAEAGFPSMPVARVEAICAGIAAHTVGFRFTVDIGLGQKVGVNCSVVEEDKISTIFEVSGLTINLGRPHLFAVENNPSRQGYQWSP